MKQVTLIFKHAERKEFDLEFTISDKFLSDHNMTLEEAQQKSLQDILAPPYNLATYFHCSTGPAMVLRAIQSYTREKDGTVVPAGTIRHVEYWLDGKRLTGKEEEEFKHSIQFSGKVQDLINED